MRVDGWLKGFEVFWQRITRVAGIFCFRVGGRLRLACLWWRLAAFVGLLLGFGLAYIGVVEAHAGGKMQVASVDGGPFKFTVWTSPDPAVTGEIHVATAVASAVDALPVLDAEVFVEMVPIDGSGQNFEGQAVTDNSANQFLYEVIFEVPEEELYEVTVTAIGGGLLFGSVTFDLEVGSAPPLGPGIAALVVLAIVTGAAVWFYLRATSPKPEVVEVDGFDASDE